MLLDLATDTSGKKDSITMYEGKEDHINDSFTKCLMILSFMWVNVSKSLIKFFFKNTIICLFEPTRDASGQGHLDYKGVRFITAMREYYGLPDWNQGTCFRTRVGFVQILCYNVFCSLWNTACSPLGFCFSSFVSSKPVLSHSLGRRPFP